MATRPARSLAARGALLLACLFLVSACAAGPATKREKGAATGAVLGAGSGAIIGSTRGDAVEGALIGGALGAIAGGILGDQAEAVDQQQAATQERLDRQQAQLAQNRELIEKLKARRLNVSTNDRGVVVTLPDVLFRFGSAELTRSARSRVRDIADVLLSDAAGRRVSVEGHTDSVGPADYNQGLSERRAAAVAAALKGDGVDARLLSSKGYGEDYPVAPNTRSNGMDDPEGRARNRRVEIVILSSTGGA